MFGLGVPEISVILVILIIIAVVTKMPKITKTLSSNESLRKCLSCNYEGEMKTWLSSYGLPQFIAIVALLCYVIPGLIFIAWAWGKRKCPNCGALAKNIPIIIHKNEISSQVNIERLKTCPFCAESIKFEAIKCKHCGSNLV